MAVLYINTFRPLASTPFGRDASERHGLPPFVDGSIRREPDFEHPQPAITCLCRAGKFTPRLRLGDRVVYLTTHGRFGGRFPHHRLVAVMEVAELFDSHELAAAWYRGRSTPLPNNIMVRGNEANPLSHSVGKGGPRRKSACGDADATVHPGHCGCNGRGGTDHAAWDASYRARSMKHPRVVRCVHLLPPMLDWDAPLLTKPQLAGVFGKDLHTRNSGRQDITLLPRLLQEAGIDVPPSSR